MRSLFTLLVFGFAVLLVAQPMVFAQAPPPGAQGQEKAAEAKVFEGQLTKVDATAKAISVKGATGPDMLFNYDDKTQVIGPAKDVQGLAGKSGTLLKVSYRQEKGSNWATRIEVIDPAK